MQYITFEVCRSKRRPIKSEDSDEFFIIFAVALSYFSLMSLRRRIMSTGGNICCFYGEIIMIKHFNTYDVYQHSNFNIYSAKDMQYLDKLHSHCRYMFLEYLIDHNIIKHMIANTDGHVFILNIRLQGFWTSTCADFTREFIEKLDELLFEHSSSIRDYVWFLKENDAESIRVFIIAFVDDSILTKLDVIAGALQDILPSQEFLKDFEINIPTVTPEYRKTLIMRHADNGLLLDCGFALDFEFPEKQNN